MKTTNNETVAEVVGGETGRERAKGGARSRRGKIARLPREVREEVNERLRDGEPAEEIVAWLNGRPEVEAVLQEAFEGRAINVDNLREWRAGGYRDWLEHEEARELAAQMIAGGEAVVEIEARAADALVVAALRLQSIKLFKQRQALEDWEEGPAKVRALLAIGAQLLQLDRNERARVKAERDWEREEDERYAAEEEEIRQMERQLTNYAEAYRLTPAGQELAKGKSFAEYQAAYRRMLDESGKAERGTRKAESGSENLEIRKSGSGGSRFVVEGRGGGVIGSKEVELGAEEAGMQESEFRSQNAEGAEAAASEERSGGVIGSKGAEELRVEGSELRDREERQSAEAGRWGAQDRTGENAEGGSRRAEVRMWNSGNQESEPGI